jgi:hypothetical protein
MLRKLAQIFAAMVVISGVGVIVAPPAQAVAYRDIKSVSYNLCFYAYGDPLEDLYLKNCSTTPAANGNWQVTNLGYHNNHPLWSLKRQGGTCIGVGGTASSNYLYQTCNAQRNVWEIFTVSNHYVLKSLSAYQQWGQHRCMSFAGQRPTLATCNTADRLQHIYK